MGGFWGSNSTKEKEDIKMQKLKDYNDNRNKFLTQRGLLHAKYRNDQYNSTYRKELRNLNNIIPPRLAWHEENQLNHWLKQKKYKEDAAKMGMYI